MAAKKKLKDEGVVFETKGTSLNALGLEDISEELKKLSYDPHLLTSQIMTFGKLLTGLPLYGYQEMTAYRIIYSIIALEGETLTMLFSRQSGKTETLAFVVDTLCVILPVLAKIFPELDQFKDGIKIGLFAPQSDQVTTTYGRAMTRLGTANAAEVMADPDLDIGLTSDVRLHLTNGSSLTGQVASKQSKIESKTYDLVLIEEAQDVDSYLIEKSIEPMVSAVGGTIVKCGTTGRVKNDFWFEIQNNKKRNRRLTDHRLAFHFEFDYKSIIRYKREQFEKDGKRFHLNYEQDILRKLKKRGEHAESFKLSYALIWSLESGMFMTDKEWDALCNNKKGQPKDPDDAETWHVVAGLDIAKDSASTVLTILRVHDKKEDEEFDPPKKEIIHWLELANMSYETQHHLLQQALVDWNVRTLVADYTGVGKPVVDRLAHAVGDFVTVVPYTFTRPSKSEMWQALRADIDSKRLIIPANKQVRALDEFRNFQDQITNLQKWYEGSYIVAEKSQGNFDDYCDSLGLATIGGNMESTPEMEDDDYNPLNEGRNDFLNSIRNSSW